MQNNEKIGYQFKQKMNLLMARSARKEEKDGQFLNTVMRLMYTNFTLL